MTSSLKTSSFCWHLFINTSNTIKQFQVRRTDWTVCQTYNTSLTLLSSITKMSLLLFSSSFPSKLQFCGKGEDWAVLGKGHMVRLSLGKSYSSSYCLHICNFKLSQREGKKKTTAATCWKMHAKFLYCL